MQEQYNVLIPKSVLLLMDHFENLQDKQDKFKHNFIIILLFLFFFKII